jgi:hypothetical protein
MDKFINIFVCIRFRQIKEYKKIEDLNQNTIKVILLFSFWISIFLKSIWANLQRFQHILYDLLILLILKSSFQRITSICYD